MYPYRGCLWFNLRSFIEQFSALLNMKFLFFFFLFSPFCWSQYEVNRGDPSIALFNKFQLNITTVSGAGSFSLYSQSGSGAVTRLSNSSDGYVYTHNDFSTGSLIRSVSGQPQGSSVPVTVGNRFTFYLCTGSSYDNFDVANVLSSVVIYPIVNGNLLRTTSQYGHKAFLDLGLYTIELNGVTGQSSYTTDFADDMEPIPDPDGEFFLVDDLELEEGENLLIKKMNPATGEPEWVWDTADGTLNGSFPKVTTPEKPLVDGDILKIGNEGAEIEGLLSTSAGGYLLWSGAGTEVIGTSMHTESYTDSSGVVQTRQVLNVSSSTMDSAGNITQKSSTIDTSKGKTKSSSVSTGGGSDGGGSPLTQSQLDESLNSPLSDFDSSQADDMASGFENMKTSFANLNDKLQSSVAAWKNFNLSGAVGTSPANFIFDINLGSLGSHHVEFPTSYFSPIRIAVLILLSILTLFTCMQMMSWK